MRPPPVLPPIKGYSEHLISVVYRRRRGNSAPNTVKSAQLRIKTSLTLHFMLCSSWPSLPFVSRLATALAPVYLEQCFSKLSLNHLNLFWRCSVAVITQRLVSARGVGKSWGGTDYLTNGRFNEPANRACITVGIVVSRCWSAGRGSTG